MSKKGKQKQHITKADIILLLFCLLAAAALTVWFGGGGREERTLRITWDGAEMRNLALPLKPKERGGAVAGEDGNLYCLMLYVEGGIMFCWYGERPDQRIEWTETRGISYNLLVVSGDRVRMEAADCKDQICVHHVPVQDAGENIICLPNRLVVEITDEADGELFDEWVQ